MRLPSEAFWAAKAGEPLSNYTRNRGGSARKKHGNLPNLLANCVFSFFRRKNGKKHLLPALFSGIMKLENYLPDGTKKKEREGSP
jgi:hypothetical protein